MNGIRKPFAAALLVSALAIGLFGCDGRRTITNEIAQAGVSVSVNLPSSLASAALKLGWPGGAIPGATVVVTSSGNAGAATLTDTALTDSNGTARFSGLPLGAYTVLASRQLSDAESRIVEAELGGVSMFTGVTSITIGSADDAVTILQLSAVDRGSLLFSEVFPSTLYDESKSLLYNYGDYIRIYNNSDSTIALANLLFVDAFPGWFNYSATNDCTTFASLSRDVNGLWAQLIYRFPASARSLRPGESALLVTDAIDHRAAGLGDPGYFDFSHADFEFRGSADVDNPSVPDMISVGPRDGGLEGHGWRGWEFRPVYALATPLDIDTLPKQFSASWDGGSNLVRIPAKAILDILSSAFLNPGAYPPCSAPLVPSLDAGEARLLNYGGIMSMHRKVSRILNSGRSILQWSHNSAADWLPGPMTPFAVP